MREKCQGFNIPRQTWQCNIKQQTAGETAWFYQLAVPAGWGLLDEKSKSLLFPGAESPWLQLTGALRQVFSQCDWYMINCKI